MARIIILIVILCALAATLGKPQDQGRPRGRQSDWYSSRSRERRPYNQRNPNDDDEPNFGTRTDYGSRDPTYGRRSRPDGARRQGIGGLPRQPQPGGYNRNQPPPPQPGRPQTPPDTPRQPVFDGYDPRPQPDYDPRPQPPPDTPRQPVYGGYDPRPQPGYDPRPQPPPDTPRQPEFGGYDPRPQPDYNPRPQPPPDTPRRPIFGGYDPKPPQYPTDTWQRPPAPQPGRPSDDRRPTDDMVNLLPGGRYQGPGNLGGSGPKDFVIGDGGVLCAPTCRGHCISRDTDCNCIQNMTCFNEYRHRLDIPAPDILYQPPDCRAMECKDPCGYKVQWPDGWCMCDIDPSCAARPASNAYTKREADLDKLISQRDAHMSELRRASRHSKKTKRHAMKTEQLN